MRTKLLKYNIGDLHARALSKISLLFLFAVLCGTCYTQTVSREFPTAQDAITWAVANKTAAVDVKHITITGNNDVADLLKIKTLNDNSGCGYFKTLESIELSAQTDTIPNSCFYSYYTGAQWLKSFSAPKITAVGSWAFRFCTGLLVVELPSVKSIGAFAFYNCSLTNIHLPASLTSIDANPFLGCRNLKAITIDSGNEYFSVEDSVLYNAGKTVLITYPIGRTITSFTSPNTVTKIGNNAFGICVGLSSVELPAVTSVKDWASEYCTGLKTVKFGAIDTISFRTDVFAGVKTTDIDLYLNGSGKEYENNVSGKIWKEYEWKSIDKEISSSTKIPDAEEPFVHIYPNSVKDMLYIDSNETINNVAVYDLNAKMIFQKKYTTNGINMSTMPIGLYIVKITTSSCEKKELILKTN